MALKRTSGLCWHVPLKKLHDLFIEHARGHQLLIVQPTIATLVYASNSRSSCYTGQYKMTLADRPFKFEEFLMSQALPGPGSIITCMIQRWGPLGPTKFITLEK